MKSIFSMSIVDALGLLHQLDRALQRGERAQAEEVHLQQADFFDDRAFKLREDVVAAVL